jgi:NADPH2:quinone reductase
MQAIRFHTIGGPDVLKLEEVEKPHPGAGEALVRIHVAGVNFADTLFRRGRYARQPRPELWKRLARESPVLSLAGG